MSTTRRKMLAADEAIANRVAEMAKRRERTVYQTVNNILELALKADQMGLALEEVIDNREMLERAKAMGLTFTMERLLYQMTDLAYDKSKKSLSELWMETGRWYGKYFSNNNKGGLEAFKEAMTLLTLGNPVFTMENSRNGNIKVTCVGENYSEGFTELQGLFIEGALDSLGYRLADKENSKGILRLNFEKSK